ncbi:hypothetical protein D9M68_993060 [compost metagenome]
MKPGTTGGRIRGRCTRLSSSDLPINDLRASSQATRTPGISVIRVHQNATFNESDSAAISAGDRDKNSINF